MGSHVLSWDRLRGAALALAERARRERSSPREVAFSVGIGVFSGCTPALGFHMWIAVGLASVFRVNRLWAFLGSRVSFAPLWTWIVFCEVELTHRLRTGAWVRLAPKEVATHAGDLLFDWLLGTLIVGGALAVVAGSLAYFAARRFTPRTPATLPPPSSESPPSAPPAPTA